MNKIHILWVDDEIDLLKPHIMFLEQRNYSVTKCSSGSEALDVLEDTKFDIVFLDENMPGLTGLETLNGIKEKQNNLPVVMITKSEEEYIMEEAIGNKIADYLIKPVNPNQILLSLKKNLDHSRLVSEKTTSNYQQEFRKIAMDLAMVNSYEEWASLYQKLIYWEIQLEDIEDIGMFEIGVVARSWRQDRGAGALGAGQQLDKEPAKRLVGPTTTATHIDHRRVRIGRHRRQTVQPADDFHKRGLHIRAQGKFHVDPGAAIKRVGLHGFHSRHALQYLFHGLQDF